MGNSSSIRPIKKSCESIECPICLEDHFKYITLNCGHKFDLYCIQMHIFLKYTNNLDIECPLCRTLISKNILNIIWNNWIIINYKFHLFSKHIILNIDNSVKINKINEIDFITDINSNKILLPICQNKPFFFVSPIINDSNVLYNDKVIELSYLLSNYTSEYEEKFNKYNYILDCYITDKRWRKFLEKIYKILKISEKNCSDFNEKFNFSEYKIRLYVTNKENVKTIDNYNGYISNDLHYFKNRKFKCVFKTYFVKNDYNFYLINELYSIIY
jgi:hypothetical protein